MSESKGSVKVSLKSRIFRTRFGRAAWESVNQWLNRFGMIWDTDWKMCWAGSSYSFSMFQMPDPCLRIRWRAPILIIISKVNFKMNKLSLGFLISLLTLASVTVVRGLSLSKEGTVSRRGFASVASVVAGSSTLLINPYVTKAQGDATPLIPYEDNNCKFSINVPSEWVKTEQSLPDRRKIVLYFKPESNQKTLMFIAYTPTRDDFTSLGSFGVRKLLDVF